MHLKSLYLRNFRNYEESFLEFSPHINIFLGSNAQGKTNLLEAIYLLIFGSSFRTKRLQELIKLDQNFFYVEAIFEKFGIEQSIKIHYSAKEKHFFYNSTEHDSLKKLLGVLHAVFLTPKDRDLIEGSPEARREYIDLQLLQEDPLYFYHLNRFYRAMNQRNWMLKSKNLLGIQCWEHEMAKSASYITQKRCLAFNDILDRSKMLHKDLCNDDFDLVFEGPTDDLENHYLTMFKKNQPKEVLLGYTLYGPHRDDFHLQLNNLKAKQYASEGQKSTIATTLRFAAWHRLNIETKEKPILCIDDIAISLDAKRRKDLMSHLNLFGQVFITSAENKDLFQNVLKKKSFFIEKGSCHSVEESIL
jgi:DNA replication and repair protein RecF